MKRRTREGRGFTLVEIMIVVAIIGILIAIAVPGFIRARSLSRMRSCQENLAKIDGAKEQWALECNQKPTAEPTRDVLAPADGSGYLKAFPVEPSGSDYAINPVSEPPVCNSGQPGHSSTEIGTPISDPIEH